MKGDLFALGRDYLFGHRGGSSSRPHQSESTAPIIFILSDSL
jgi:hypothetical protein